MIAAIVATDLNNAIGLNNQLLWRLPADMKFFKNTTLGWPVVMGRKTFESIAKLLPGRKNLIVTRNTRYCIEGAEIYTSPETALASCNDEKIFVIGGAEIYKLSLRLCDKIYRTLVKHRFEADAFFPEIDPAQFKLVWEECYSADEKNPYDYCFQEWVRITQPASII